MNDGQPGRPLPYHPGQGLSKPVASLPQASRSGPEGSAGGTLRERAEAFQRAHPPRPMRPPPADEGERLATLARADGSELRVSWARYEGRAFLSLRVWSRGDGGAWWPDPKRGLAIKLRELPDVALALAAALDRAEREGGP